MPFNGKRSYRKKRGFTKKRSYKKRGGVSSSIKRYVKRTIHSNIENKVEILTGGNEYLYPYVTNGNIFTKTCIPYTNITQGTGMDRIGNVIKTRSCMFSYIIFENQYDAVFNPIPRPQDVLVFFGKLKNSKPTAPTITEYAKLFQGGDTSVAPVSLPLDMVQSVNKDLFTVFKVFRHKVGYSINTNSGANVAAASYANNDYKISVTNKVNCTKWCPKTLKFNDTTNIPTNDGLYMWAMCSNADGTVATASRPLFISYNVTYFYEDA